MRRILVMEEHELGNGLCAFLAMAGYEVILTTTHNAATAALNGEKRIDFVISAGLRWKPCYELALSKFGYMNVLIFTGAPEVKKELEARKIVVFEKPTVFEDLLEHIVRVCPPN